MSYHSATDPAADFYYVASEMSSILPPVVRAAFQPLLDRLPNGSQISIEEVLQASRRAKDLHSDVRKWRSCIIPSAIAVTTNASTFHKSDPQLTHLPAAKHYASLIYWNMDNIALRSKSLTLTYDREVVQAISKRLGELLIEEPHADAPRDSSRQVATDAMHCFLPPFVEHIGDKPMTEVEFKNQVRSFEQSVQADPLFQESVAMLEPIWDDLYPGREWKPHFSKWRDGHRARNYWEGRL